MWRFGGPGGFYLEAMDAHGGWVASTIDLPRFLTALDGWAALFNAREMVPNAQFETLIDAKMWEAVRGVTAWPSHDLFSRFP